MDKGMDLKEFAMSKMKETWIPDWITSSLTIGKFKTKSQDFQGGSNM